MMNDVVPLEAVTDKRGDVLLTIGQPVPLISYNKNTHTTFGLFIEISTKLY